MSLARQVRRFATEITSLCLCASVVQKSLAPKFAINSATFWRLTPSKLVRIMAPVLADVAELADAQVSEACDGDIVEVQVLSSAPSNNFFGGSVKRTRRFSLVTQGEQYFLKVKIFCHGFPTPGVFGIRGPV